MGALVRLSLVWYAIILYQVVFRRAKEPEMHHRSRRANHARGALIFLRCFLSYPLRDYLTVNNVRQCTVGSMVNLAGFGRVHLVYCAPYLGSLDQSTSQNWLRG